MSALRKTAEWLGFLPQRWDEVTDEGEDPTPVTPIYDAPSARSRPSAVPFPPPQRMDLSRIQSVKPRAYNDARSIGEAYRQGVPVIMNVSDMPEADAKRLVDFTAGLSFGLGGTLERVAPSVFVISPAHVEISMAVEAEQTERGFFNQS